MVRKIVQSTFKSICLFKIIYDLGIMPHCIFGDAMDKSNVQIFNGSHWEEEIKTKSHIKSYSNQ